MKLDIVARNKNDEYYTPAYAITPLLQYIPEKSRIWCPFDKPESKFVTVFRENGYFVKFSHIDDGVDFFKASPVDVDYIISNPPYSKKTEVLERLFNMKIPFAMLLGVVGLFESQRRFDMFKNNKWEIMYFNKRIKYYNGDRVFVSPPFSSVYITSGILPKSVVFEQIVS